MSVEIALTTEAVARFWSKVDKSGECWLWTGYARNGQHGSLWLHGKNVYVHRLSYVIHFGDIPPGMVVCHRCDVPRCVRPKHLFLGSQEDNIADMHKKSRARQGHLYGECHPAARLSDEQVRQIRRLRAEGVHQRAVARQFGVSQSTVWRLANGVVRSSA